MKRAILALLAALAFAGPVLAQQTLPPSTVVGRMPPNAGPAQAIPFATLGPQLGISPCPALGGFSVGTGTITQCSTAAGAVAHLGATSDLYDFWIARPSATTGTLLQTQYGKVGNLATANVPVFNLQAVFDSGSPGGKIFTGISVESRLQAGTRGTALGGQFYGRAESAWSGVSPGDGGATGVFAFASVNGPADAFGGNSWAEANTAPGGTVISWEFDTNAVVDVLAKKGIQIADISTSVGTVPDAANIGIHFLAQTGAYGYAHAIAIGDVSSQFPLRTTGSIIKTIAGTVATGIDLSPLTITGNAFVSNGFTVNGAGQMTVLQSTGQQFLASGLAGTFTGELRLLGVTSGIATIRGQAAAGSPVLLTGTTSGTIAASATSPLAISATTGVITCTTCGVTGSPLSQFAATTSAQLAGVISNETGSGLLVFNTSPALTAPITISAAAVARLSIIGGTGNGEGGQLAIGQSGLEHSFGVEKAILGGASTNFIFYADASAAAGIDIYTNNANRIAIAGSTGVVTFGAGVASTSATTGTAVITGGLGVSGAIWAGTYLNTTTNTVNGLPACGAGIKGARTFVNDNATALAFGAVITTAGAIQTPVYCDGTIWRQGANDNMPAHIMRKFA